jgi:hypothetical protein
LASQYISINLSEKSALRLLVSLIFGNYSKETVLGQRQQLQSAFNSTTASSDQFSQICPWWLSPENGD